MALMPFKSNDLSIDCKIGKIAVVQYKIITNNQ